MSDMNEVISKVKKLFALSSSSNEHEAALAMEKAHAMLKEYNLTSADIQADSKYGIMEQAVLESKNQSIWKSIIIMGVCEANYCMSLTSRGYTTTEKIIGKEHNIVVAKAMIEYLIATVERLSKRLPGSDRGSYKKGISSRLYERLLETLKKEEVECTALVVQEKAMIQDFIKGKNIKNTSISLKVSNGGAYYKGIADANDISLSNQVGSSKPSSYIG
jgi:hypothetical protein